MNLYNSKTRAQMRKAWKQAEAQRVRVTADTMMRKTCIVSDMNGRQIDRLEVTTQAGSLDRRYGEAVELMLKLHPRAYIFCDHSEGRIVPTA